MAMTELVIFPVRLITHGFHVSFYTRHLIGSALPTRLPGRLQVLGNISAGGHGRVDGHEPEILAGFEHHGAEVFAGLVGPALGHREGDVAQGVYFVEGGSGQSGEKQQCGKGQT